MIKASEGGGGKGIRKASSDDEFTNFFRQVHYSTCMPCSSADSVLSVTCVYLSPFPPLPLRYMYSQWCIATYLIVACKQALRMGYSEICFRIVIFHLASLLDSTKIATVAYSNRKTRTTQADISPQFWANKNSSVTHRQPRPVFEHVWAFLFDMCQVELANQQFTFRIWT